MNTELIRLKRISEITSLTTTTLRRMIKRNELKAVVIGGNYYIRPNDYIEFMFNLECERLGITSDEAKRLMKDKLENKFAEISNKVNNPKN